MSDEINNKAIELSDEEIEKASGGHKHKLHTCSLYANLAPGTVGEEYCHGFCQYGQSSYTHPSQCTDGQTEVSNDDIMSAFYYWTGHGMNG